MTQAVHAADPVTSKSPLLVLEDLSVRYTSDGPLIHRDLTTGIRRGEFLSIVGPSGCGKTTLLRIMGGLLHPTMGRVTLRGVPVTKPAKEMAIVFQDYASSLFPWLTVRRNVGFPLVGRKGLSKSDKRTIVDRALGDVGLADAAGKYPWQLSGGMQQRVAIARAIAAQPEILLLDEPFASVDALTREGLEDLVLELRTERGYAETVVLVTHDIGEAIYMADRVLVLSSPPTRILADLGVSIPRPRNQIATRSDPKFLSLMKEIHALIGAKTPN